MENLEKFYINGHWVTPDSKKNMPVLNPSNLEELGKVALGNEKDVNIAVEAAKRAFETYSKTTKKDRLALLKELKFVTEKKVRRFGASYAARNGRSNFNGTFSPS